MKPKIKKLYSFYREMKDIGEDEEFEPRCLNKFWLDPEHPERKTIMQAILDNGIDKKEAYMKLEMFLQRYHTIFPQIKMISDNSAYDLARISQGLKNHSSSGEGLEFLGGIYRGFGLHTEDYMKGILNGSHIPEDQLIKELDIQKHFEDVIKKYELKIKMTSTVPFKSHCALYDAIEIGLKHLLLEKALLLEII